MGMYRISVFVHLLGACVWIGGMIFLAAVVLPGLRRAVDEDTRRAILADAGYRFRTIGWIVLVAMLVTGLYNLAVRGVSLGMLLSGSGDLVDRARWKLGLMTTVMIVSAVHDFWLGPRAVDAATETERDRLRRAASWVGRVNLLLALLLVWLGLRIVRG
ncbi:MAG: DUF4149 domain-containing protein [Candidatus Dadabacteria bacterium]|nr:MAG: DUF4149 domain-containing protein [Candidatus Dadabacteria bacterium]